MARRKKEQPMQALTTAVIYARYSSHAQKEESIEQQVEECMAFAEQNGLKVVNIYADKAVSGKTDRRSSFQRMMRDAEKLEFSVVIAYKSNRISRNMLQALTYENKLENLGVRTLYAKEEFGNTAAGRFALRTMMNVNQFYSENMAEDIRRGMADNAANCKVNGSLPFGYKSGEDGKFAVDEDSAKIVREIFDKVLAGARYVDIANDLNARGIRTKSGARWNKSSFYVMMRNDAYIGTYRFSGTVIENGVPPIIQKEVFYAVQEKMKNKNPRGRAQNGEYLLTGKLFCGYCNSHMVGVSGTSKTGVKHYYYMCNNRRQNQGCKKEYVRRDDLEKKISEMVFDVVGQDDVIDWIADNAVSFQLEAQRESEIATMEDALAENRKAARNIMKAIEQGIITATTKSRLEEIEDEISELKRSISLTKAAQKPIDRERIIYSLKRIQEGDVNDKAFQRRLIDTFVKAVYLWDDKIRIDCYHDGNNSTITATFYEKSEHFGVLTDSLEGHHEKRGCQMASSFFMAACPKCLAEFAALGGK